MDLMPGADIRQDRRTKRGLALRLAKEMGQRINILEGLYPNDGNLTDAARAIDDFLDMIEKDLQREGA